MKCGQVSVGKQDHQGMEIQSLYSNLSSESNFMYFEKVRYTCKLIYFRRTFNIYNFSIDTAKEN